MKKILLLLILVSSFVASSQDTIFLKNGSIIPCKIEKVGKKDVYYKIPQQTKDSVITINENDVKEMLVKEGVDVLKMKDGRVYRGKLGKQENGMISFFIQNEKEELIKYLVTDSILKINCNKNNLLKQNVKIGNYKSINDTIIKNKKSKISFSTNYSPLLPVLPYGVFWIGLEYLFIKKFSVSILLAPASPGIGLNYFIYKKKGSFSIKVNTFNLGLEKDYWVQSVIMIKNNNYKGFFYSFCFGTQYFAGKNSKFRPSDKGIVYFTLGYNF